MKAQIVAFSALKKFSTFLNLPILSLLSFLRLLSLYRLDNSSVKNVDDPHSPCQLICPFPSFKTFNNLTISVAKFFLVDEVGMTFASIFVLLIALGFAPSTRDVECGLFSSCGFGPGFVVEARRPVDYDYYNNNNNNGGLEGIPEDNDNSENDGKLGLQNFTIQPFFRKSCFNYPYGYVASHYHDDDDHHHHHHFDNKQLINP